MSTLRANAINDVEGTTKFYDGSPTIDLWRLSANFSTDNGTITGWERPDESSIVGVSVNGLTESSGIFTFPSTGIYHRTPNLRQPLLHIRSGNIPCTCNNSDAGLCIHSL